MRRGTHLGIMALGLMAFKSASDQADVSLQVLSELGLAGIALWSPWDAWRTIERDEFGAGRLGWNSTRVRDKHTSRAFVCPMSV